MSYWANEQCRFTIRLQPDDAGSAPGPEGQQQVTVEQAVVGNVQSSPQSQPSRNQEPPALTDQSGMGMEIDAKLVPVKEPAKRRG